MRLSLPGPRRDGHGHCPGAAVRPRLPGAAQGLSRRYPSPVSTLSPPPPGRRRGCQGHCHSLGSTPSLPRAAEGAVWATSCRALPAWPPPAPAPSCGMDKLSVTLHTRD